MATITWPGMTTKGTLAGRPAANAVGGGAFYSATDVGIIYQSDGVSTWSVWATVTPGASGPAAQAAALVYAFKTFR